ncbi:MAG: hypothetical protein A2Y23_01170 [Clostridiales bacterium GWB2_37_7]|nr:MAG: hypothetical protein A2Y23_01170 [Clostridiales bacterium GWB2_37_7]
MRIDKSKVLKAIKKIMTVTIAAIIVNAMMLITLDTYSWFVSYVQSNTIVRAAATDDILRKMEIVDEEDQHYDLINGNKNKTILNPEYILIQGKNDEAYTIYFELSDSIKEFIPHVNPLYVDNEGKEKAYLNISLNPKVYNELKQELESEKGERDKNPIKGTIKVKYLNSYINRTVNIAFTRDFLLSKDKESVNYYVDLENKIEAMQKKLEKLTEDNTKLIEINKGLEKDKSDLEKDVEKLENKIKDLKDKISDYYSKVKKLEEAKNDDVENKDITNTEDNEVVKDDQAVESESKDSNPIEEQKIEQDDNKQDEEPHAEKEEVNLPVEKPDEKPVESLIKLPTGDM